MPYSFCILHQKLDLRNSLSLIWQVLDHFNVTGGTYLLKIILDTRGKGLKTRNKTYPYNSTGEKSCQTVPAAREGGGPRVRKGEINPTYNWGNRYEHKDVGGMDGASFRWGNGQRDSLLVISKFKVSKIKFSNLLKLIPNK